MEKILFELASSDEKTESHIRVRLSGMSEKTNLSELKREIDRIFYDELIRYLKRMQQYIGGKEMVRSLCNNWIVKYPTRKVMVQELSKML